jgi:C-terminal processing protease CtpA/Prc
MGRVLTASLAVLALYLAAVNARLNDRIRNLERRPSAPAVAKKLPAVPAPAEAVEAGPATSPAAPAPRVAAAVPARPDGRVPFVVASGTVDLGLSDAQKTVIDQLKKNRDEEAQVYRDLVKGIEERTERSIRELLSPEQLAKHQGEAGIQEWAARVLADTAVQDRPSGYLGVAGDDGTGGGARLSQVFPNTPAHGSGLRTGDVVLEFNGESLKDYEALASRMRETSPGATVVMKIQRDGSEFTQGVQVGSRPR